MTSIVGYI